MVVLVLETCVMIRVESKSELVQVLRLAVVAVLRLELEVVVVVEVVVGPVLRLLFCGSTLSN
jgi:hypothetical protein